VGIVYLERYDRQIKIIGVAGQERLKQARVFVAGCGGLGSAAAMYLAAAGVGKLRLVDGDFVTLDNLNRQVLHWDEDIGRSKVVSAAEKLQRLNRGVEIEGVDEMIDERNVLSLVSGFDLIVDATDNLSTRYLLNKVAVDGTLPLFHGAVYGFEGRAMTVLPGKTACLRCIYRGAFPGEDVPVIGATAAVVGGIQAAEVIKYITGTGTLLTGRLLVFNGLSMKFTELNVTRDPGCEHCGRLEEPG
jgi:molybdopterin-synthase adenylyltransferase